MSDSCCIATHAKPDADALVSAWLARRFLLSGREPIVTFVGRSFRDKESDAYAAVVDVGCRYDPFELRFDHKPPGVRDRHSTCATRMVWEHLLADGWSLLGLAGLVDAVHDGDSVRRRAGSVAYLQSRQEGLHAHVAEIQHAITNDLEVYARVESWLDLYAEKHCGLVKPGDMNDSEQQLGRLVRYGRGRVYFSTLESERSENVPDSNPRRYPAAFPALGRWDKQWRVAERLSERYQCDPKQLRADSKWAFAVDTLAEHVDAQVRIDLLAPDCILSDKTIQAIANTAPPRMGFAVEQFRAGCRRPLAVKTEVFDTVAFVEVITRIARADGSIRSSLDYLKGPSTPTIGSQVRLAESVVCELLNVLGTCPCIDDELPTPNKSASVDDRQTKPGDRNMLNTGIVLLTKCIRDIPRLPESLRPTPEERDRCCERLRRLKQQIENFISALNHPRER